MITPRKLTMGSLRLVPSGALDDPAIIGPMLLLATSALRYCSGEGFPQFRRWLTDQAAAAGEPGTAAWLAQVKPDFPALIADALDTGAA
jgi:hypothetical protein